ncbi:hypothetical protein KCU73_g50, partial [Aureobasidium melanogenum]
LGAHHTFHTRRGARGAWACAIEVCGECRILADSASTTTHDRSTIVNVVETGLVSVARKVKAMDCKTTRLTFAGAGSKSHGVTSLLVFGVRGRDADGLPGRVVAVTCVALDGLRPLLSDCSGTSLGGGAFGSNSSPKKPCNFLWNLPVILRFDEPVEDIVVVLATDGLLSSPCHSSDRLLPFCGMKPGDIWGRSSLDEL